MGGDAVDRLGDTRRRKIAAFTRLLTLFLSLDEVTRNSIAAMAAMIGDPLMPTCDVDGMLAEIEDLLFAGDEG